MAIQHKDLTGADLHEPKGAASATSGQVYVADGSGSGSWQNPLTNVKNLNSFVRDVTITDIGTANSNAFLVANSNCRLTRIRAVVDASVTGDAIISLYRAGVLLGQTMTIPASGSGAGVTTTLTLSPAYDFTAGQTLELRSDGGPSTVNKVWFTLEFTAT